MAKFQRLKKGSLWNYLSFSPLRINIEHMILKSILKDKGDKIITKIKQGNNLFDFLEEAKKNSKELEEVVGKEDAQKILDILNAQKIKKSIVKKEINLSSTGSDGVNDIKVILNPIKNAKIKYISGGKYSIELESDDMKTAGNEIRKILEEIEKNAKNRRVDFSIKEK